jgi:hypothetical protein
MSRAALWIAFLVIVFALFRVTKRRKRAIRHPRLAFLDVTSGASEALVEKDRLALQGLFSEIAVSRDAVPKCDVLFLYATLDAEGALRGTDRSLRATIRASGAKVVVIASENPNPPPSPGRPVYGRANLVITLARNGDAFGRFFRELFGMMMQGKPMPMAWVQLAPQAPGNLLKERDQDVPGTIFLCELGGISFR